MSGPWEGALAPWSSESQEEKASESPWQALNSPLTVTQSSYLLMGFEPAHCLKDEGTPH